MAGSIVARPGIRLIAALLIAVGVVFAGIGAAEGAKKKVKVKTKAEITRTETGVNVKVKANKPKGNLKKKVKKKAQKACVKKREASLSYLPAPLPTQAVSAGAQQDDPFIGLSEDITNKNGEAFLPWNLPIRFGLPPEGTYRVEVKKLPVNIKRTPFICKAFLRLFDAPEEIVEAR